MKDVLSLLICFLIGVGCRAYQLPLPAPIHITGVLMIFMIWLGYKLKF